MPMQCPRCGFQINDGAPACPNCGTPVNGANGNQQQMNYQPDFQQPQNFQPNYQQPNFNQGNPRPKIDGAAITAFVNQNKKLIGIGAAALIVLIIIINLISGAGPKGAALKFLKGVANANANAVYSATAPGFRDFDKSEMKEMLKDGKESIKESYGLFARYSFKVDEVTDYEEYYEDMGYSIDLDDLNDSYESICDSNDVKYREITKAAVVTVDVEIKGSEDSSDYTTNVICVKIGGKWYVQNMY